MSARVPLTIAAAALFVAGMVTPALATTEAASDAPAAQPAAEVMTAEQARADCPPQGHGPHGAQRQPLRDGRGPHAGLRQGLRDGRGPNALTREPRRDGHGPHGERRRERGNEDCRRR